ncbi:MAG: TIGR01777 family oxidoreductase [Pirellulales bacterium]|nr:TIGR01777 family oxidoreductase [Pirellulales bacterium]
MSEVSSPPEIVVTGATGLVGSRLVSALDGGPWRVVRAVRRAVRDPHTEMHWDPVSGEIDRDRLAGAQAVVHLAGANIAGRRWSEKQKTLILNSRVAGTELISRTMASLERKGQVLISASAIGYYGNRGNEQLNEGAASGDDFLAEVCMQWERACQPARDAAIRVANLRIGVVLSPDGGALAKMLLPFKLGAGGPIGNGRQYFSWIALDDVVRAIRFVLEHKTLSGPINLVAPGTVTNREYTKTLGRILSRPTILPMPEFAARLAFGEMADALLLSSTRVVPTVLTGSGFQFQYPLLEPALRHLLGKA